MKEIIKKPWDYTFIENEGRYILSVVCGTVGVFEVNIELNSEEIMQYEDRGLNYIERLAKDIQSNPPQYASRNFEVK